MGNDWSTICQAVSGAGKSRASATSVSAVLISCWCTTALAGVLVCALWWKAGDRRKKAWPLYGRFVLLLVFASIAGSIYSGASMSFKDTVFQSEQFHNENQNRLSFKEYRSKQASLYAEAYSWNAVAAIFYGFKVLFMFSAKIQIMDRLVFFSYLMPSPSLTQQYRDRVLKIQDCFFYFIYFSCAAGCCLLFAQAYHDQLSSSKFFDASKAYNEGNIGLGNQSYTDAFKFRDEGEFIRSFQLILEGCVLAFIVLVFVIVGGRCIMRIHRQMQRSLLNPSKDTDDLQLKMYCTVGVVFVSFLIRSAFILYLAALSSSINSRECVFNPQCKRCGSCQCSWRHLYVWNEYTPQLETAINLVSSPVTLLAVLWGMTSVRIRQVCTPRS